METDGGKRWKALEDLRNSLERIEKAFEAMDYGITSRVHMPDLGDLVFTLYQGKWCLLLEPLSASRMSTVQHEPLHRQSTAAYSALAVTRRHKLGLPVAGHAATLRCGQAVTRLLEKMGRDRSQILDDFAGTKMLVDGLADSLEADQD